MVTAGIKVETYIALLLDGVQESGSECRCRHGRECSPNIGGLCQLGRDAADELNKGLLLDCLQDVRDVLKGLQGCRLGGAVVKQEGQSGVADRGCSNGGDDLGLSVGASLKELGGGIEKCPD